MPGLLDGLPIIDATEAMDLHVLRTDINRKAKRDPGHCALAECMMRQSGYQEVKVYLSRAYVKDGDHWVRYEVGQLARREITAFDRGGSFQPGLYRLNVPSQQYKQSRKGKNNGGVSRRPRAIPQITANIRPRSAVIANAGKRN